MSRIEFFTASASQVSNKPMCLFQEVVTHVAFHCSEPPNASAAKAVTISAMLQTFRGSCG
jgi:hypothetical protein